MMLRLVKDVWPLALVALVVLVATVVYPKWRAAVDRNLDARADPHHIAGNLYFVGAPDIASFLLTGSDGDILIGAGAYGNAHKIVDNIDQLGFDIKAVRILLASDPHDDEAGGLAGLQKASGAEVWTSAENAPVIASGGTNDPSIVYTPYKLMQWARVTDYAPAHVDHVLADGETIRLGSLAVTAHITPGHAPGCITWTFTVREKDRDLRVAHRCSLRIPDGASLIEPDNYPGIRNDFERSFKTLRGLPVDIWLTSRGVEYGRFRKYDASRRAEDRVAPFVDPQGYLKTIDDAEARFRKLLAEQQQGTS